MQALRSLVYLLSAVMFLGAGVLWLRSDVDPALWTPAPLPELAGEFSTKRAGTFDAARFIDMPATGPEDVALGPDGFYYTGLSDGRIERFGHPSQGVTESVINTGGRPLGLEFDSAGNLVIADAVKGLLKLSPDGQLDVLVSEIDGRRLRLADDLDVASDGTIWFTDASQRFGLENYMKDFLEASFTGRLLSYDPATLTTSVHMDGLFFANGVALGPDEKFVVVAETGTGRLHRLWLKTDRAGQRDLFHEGLPGHPDNVSFNGEDTFWVALPALRNRARERTSDAVFIRRLLGGLPSGLLQLPSTVGFVVGLDRNGAVTHLLFDDPAPLSSITSANQFAEHLLLGSLGSQRVAIVPAPAASTQATRSVDHGAVDATGATFSNETNDR